MAQTVTTDELLAAYAAGATSPGLSLLVASHLTLAPEARDKVAAFESLGGATLAKDEAEPLGAGALASIMARLDCTAQIAEDERITSGSDEGSEALPRPILDALGAPDRLRWGFRLPGLSAIDIGMEDGEEERVQLLRARPGVKIPEHTHRGTEYTLVLSGALRDGDEVYGAGQIEIADGEHTHRPMVDGSETCYCLIVLDGSLRFTGRFTRALNYLGA